MLFSDSLPPDLLFSRLPGCDCTDGCVDPRTCACLLRSRGVNYIQNTRKLHESITNSPTVRHPIYECNPSCSCSNCFNRLVGNDPEDFSLLKSINTGSTKGLGASAARDIKSGEFVCIYSGLYVNPKDAGGISRAQASNYGHVYVLTVREFSGEGGKMVFETVVDGACDGAEDLPLPSLINHSCEPNLTVIPVRVDSILPYLAFFAKKNISVGEELSYDYGECADGTTSTKPCLCGSSHCRGFLPNHDAVN